MRTATRTVLAAALAAAVGSPGGGPSSIHTLALRDPWWRPSQPPEAAVSANGDHVAFASYARLVPADTNNRRDIYVLDRRDGQVTLESLPPAGIVSQSDSGHPRISGDGRFLVYETAATLEGVPPWRSGIVLRDRREGTLTVISAGPGGEPGDGPSRSPAISLDGRVIAFSSLATNLVHGGDANGREEDVYVFDTRTAVISRVSVDRTGRQPASGGSVSPAISGDGRYVAFTSSANLDGAPPAARGSRPVPAVFVRDRERLVTTRVSRAPGGRKADGGSWMPSISADGRFVAFVSLAANLVSADRNRSADVFLADLQAGSLELLSRRAGAEASASGSSGNPSLSADGRYVAFQSDASDILCARRCTPATEDINLLWDVFLLERLTGAIVRLSGDATEAWMAPSAAPSISATGELVVFSSRHPIDATDTLNDFDLFVCAVESGGLGGGASRERADGVHHRHQPHALSH